MGGELRFIATLITRGRYHISLVLYYSTRTTISSEKLTTITENVSTRSLQVHIYIGHLQAQMKKKIGTKSIIRNGEFWKARIAVHRTL